MSNNKQTAVEWLVNVVQSCIAPDYIPIEIVKQAKAMHKEEIIDSFGVGCQVESTRLIGYQGMAEQYYNKEYGKDTNDNTSV